MMSTDPDDHDEPLGKSSSLLSTTRVAMKFRRFMESYIREVDGGNKLLVVYTNKSVEVSKPSSAYLIILP